MLAVNPDHPGAIHLYIHLIEASATPERAEPHADRLGALMPGAGHIVHMPAHTYTGSAATSIRWRPTSPRSKPTRTIFARAQGTVVYAYGYYPHNIHFLLVSAQMAGTRSTRRRRSDSTASSPTRWRQRRLVQPILQAPYYAHAQYSAPDTVLALPDPGDKFPFVKAMWHYARGVAVAAKGDFEAARSEAARIAEIGRTQTSRC